MIVKPGPTAIPQSGEAPPTWDSAELPAPVPAGLIAAGPFINFKLENGEIVSCPTQWKSYPLNSAVAPEAAPPPLSANQLMLQARAGFEQLEWCVPAHDGPWSPSPDTHAQMVRHVTMISLALTALLSIPTITPAPIEEEPDVEA